MTSYDPGVEVSDQDVLCLHRNENLFVGRDWAVDVARTRVEDARIASYPDSTCRALRRALAEHYGVGADNVFVGNGADQVLSDLLGLLRSQYDTLGVLDVCFKIYHLLTDRFQFKLTTIPGNTFVTGQIVTDDWHGLALVDSPNAITGNRLSSEALMSLAADDGSFLIWDNVYGEFAGDELPLPLQKNTVFVRSFSKFYALAGLRLGYCIADSAIIHELLDRKDAFNVNGLAQEMALEALRRRDMFRDLKSQMVICRAELVTKLKQLGFTLHDPAANYVLVKHSTLPAEFIQRALLEQKIAVRRFAQQPVANHLRITIPTMAGVERLTAALRAVCGKPVPREYPTSAETAHGIGASTS